MTRKHSLAAAVVLTTGLALAGCGGQSGEQAPPHHSGHSRHSGHSGHSQGSSTAAGRKGDISFAQRMIPHHEQAVRLSRLALTPRTHSSAEVQALARKIRQAQQPEIGQMTRWLMSWGAPLTMPGMTAGDHMEGMDGMVSERDMMRLGQSKGRAFDRLWLTLMTRHHQGAVGMAQDVLRTTHDSRVKHLAQEIISGQQSEIRQMQRMRQQS